MRLVITNFASIKNVEIDFRRFTVIIGEQASGKSLISKLYFFAADTVADVARRAIAEDKPIKSLQSILSIAFNTYFPTYSWKSNSFKILAFESGEEVEPDISITYRTGGNGIRFAFSKKFKSEYRMIQDASRKARRELDLEKRHISSYPWYSEIRLHRIVR